MKRRLIGAGVIAVGLCSLLLMGGCSKKQVREDSETATQTRVTEAPAPTPRPVRETPIQTKKPEPAPSRSAAAEPAPTKPVAGGGLAQASTGGLERIHFEFDKSTITSEARDILAKNADFLLASQGMRIRIEGHCDERGTTEYNLALGERRAKSAFQYLMDLGVDPNRMSVVSYGEESPLDPGHDENAWAQNRRAEFVEIQR